MGCGFNIIICIIFCDIIDSAIVMSFENFEEKNALRQTSVHGAIRQTL